MKTITDLVVVLPVGPNTDPAFIADTLDSIAHHVRASYRLIIADDSHSGLGRLAKQHYPEADLVSTPKNMGRYGGLYITLCMAYRHAVENYHFRALLKIDTDAMMIGDAPEAEAIRLFDSDKRVGMAGQYGIEYDGRPWNINWPKQRIINGTSTWKFIRRPIANMKLRQLYKRALVNGYNTGESVFGGSYFMSPSCLAALYADGLLPAKSLRTVNLEEDHIFSLLVKSSGFTLADLSRGSLPFGCSWRGLPDSPEGLLDRGKKIIHSTRYWGEMKEREIREFFRERRG
jgi:hypothetical protein